MAAPLNFADSPYTRVLNRLFPHENRGKHESLRTFDLILSNDVDGLRTWVSDPDEGEKRANTVATAMRLHPLHVCAMAGSLECAKTLIDTKVCKIDPQDASGATPLHHAAVRTNKAMIGCFLKSGATRLLDRHEGSYLSILSQMQAPKPEVQVFYYRDEAGKLIKGDGNDFKRLTGAAFLDKDCRITPKEWLKLWQNKAQEPSLLPPSLEARYEEFSKNPPKLTLEKHPVVGLTVISGQDFVPGMVIGEYLGEIRKGAGLDNFCSVADKEAAALRFEYTLGNIDGTHSRGIIPMVNDSFPNAMAFDICNKKGLPLRTVVVAIHPIKKGEPVVFNYGLGHRIRFANRIELRREAFLNYFKVECARGFPALVNKAIGFNDGALRLGRLSDGDENMPQQALLYAFTTPAAMLHLLCEGTIRIDEIKPLFSSSNAGVMKALKMWINANNFPFDWALLDCFYQTAFRYFDKLETISSRARNVEIELLRSKIDSHDANGLIKLMGGDSEAQIGVFNQPRFSDLQALLKAVSDGKGND